MGEGNMRLPAIGISSEEAQSVDQKSISISGCAFREPTGRESMMNQKISKASLLIFVVSSLLPALLSAQSPQKPTTAPTQKPKFVAYYFHATFRCPTCRKIEQLSAEAINNSFSSELKSGTLEFRRVNVEEPQNRHFVSDFKPYTRSLFIVRYSGDKVEQHKNLTRVWELVQSPQQFGEYVRTEIGKFMGGRS
jgi:hypothetical protein